MTKSLKKYNIGLVDADLLNGGTRHPNLALMKIAGYLYDNNISFELLIDPNQSIDKYDYIYMSKVFTFTPYPSLYTEAGEARNKFIIGGTGNYATETNTKTFISKTRIQQLLNILGINIKSFGLCIRAVFSTDVWTFIPV